MIKAADSAECLNPPVGPRDGVMVLGLAAVEVSLAAFSEPQFAFLKYHY